MSARQRRMAEQRAAVVGLLLAHGVKEYAEKNLKSGHMGIDFYRGGKRHRVVIDGSGDWRAIRNTVSITRNILRRAEWEDRVCR